jgi:hypothetical protein
MTSTKYCIDCQWFKAERIVCSAPNLWSIAELVYGPPYVSKITSSPREHGKNPEADNQLIRLTACGLDGKWWEPKQ